MGRRRNKRRMPRNRGAASASAPTNADWEDATAAFREEAEAALRSLSIGEDDGAAAERLAARHRGSPLAHHVVGHARAALARAGDAVAQLRRAAGLAPGCRVAVARERLRGVRADAEALTGVSHQATVPPPPPPSRSRRSALPDTDDEVWSFLTVRVEDLTAHCAKIGSSAGALAVADAVEFVKATNASVYWLCPVCDEVFLDSNSFQSHVESEYIHQLKQLLPLMQPSTTMKPTSKDSSWWKPIGAQEEEEEIARIREAFSIVNGSEVSYLGCVAFSILDGPEIPSIDLMVFSSLDEPEVSSVEPVSNEVKFKKGRRRRLKKWDAWLDHCREIERDCPSWEELLLPLCKEMPELWEHLESCVETEENENSFPLISLFQDGSALFLDSQKIARRDMDGSINVDALFNWLLRGSSPQKPVPSWTSIRKRCVHDGNEVLKRIGEISDLLQEQFGLKGHSEGTMHGDFFTTKAKLNNGSPGKELHDMDDIHEEYVVQEKSEGADSDLDHQISMTEELENSSLSFSDSSDLSTLETESTSFNSGIGTVHQISTDELSLNVTLRALWHLRRFHVFRQIPHTLHHISVRDHCIVCLLCEIFYAWDHNENHTAAILLVFSWPTEKENYVDMSEVLINIAAPLDIIHTVYEVDIKRMYSLITVVCCVDDEHVCFARGEGKWIIYESQTVEFADCWESLLQRYRGRILRPQILFFEML
ncbi:hypothetical protein DAI22_11g185600 [Oryza sativa Japonica Group]|nr:hypothetical protein DAI22_11g185600 [Oryza sativa Japonica Group]